MKRELTSDFSCDTFKPGDRARRSPRKLPSAMKEEKRKWAMPKFLPHKYDVKLVNEDKVGGQTSRRRHRY